MSYKEDLQAINTELREILTTVDTLPSGSNLPTEVSSEEDMTNILNNATAASVGAVYKYVGETTSTYEKDALYIITEVIA